ncbi:MAG: pyridoxamine 5'-phosphate oxidase family protein [Sulfuricurvum sp.]
MISEKLQEVLAHEGAMAIATNGEEFPHIVNTWHSYVIVGEDAILVPVGGMTTFEKLLEANSKVSVTVGSKEVEGNFGMGAGFFIIADASFELDTPEHEVLKTTYPWCRAVLKLKVLETHQTV